MKEFLEAKDKNGAVVYVNPAYVKYVARDTGMMVLDDRSMFVVKPTLMVCHIEPHEDEMYKPRPIVKIDKPPVWTSVKDDMPAEGKYVEVCTEDGQVFVSSVLCGKFPASVGWWRELPEPPEEVRKKRAEMLESK